MGCWSSSSLPRTLLSSCLVLWSHHRLNHPHRAHRSQLVVHVHIVHPPTTPLHRSSLTPYSSLRIYHNLLSRLPLPPRFVNSSIGLTHSYTASARHLRCPVFQIPCSMPSSVTEPFPRDLSPAVLDSWLPRIALCTNTTIHLPVFRYSACGTSHSLHTLYLKLQESTLSGPKS